MKVQKNRTRVIRAICLIGIGLMIWIAAILFISHRNQEKQYQSSAMMTTSESSSIVTVKFPEFLEEPLWFTGTDAERYDALLEHWEECRQIVCYEIKGIGTDCLLTEEEKEEMRELFSVAVPTEEEMPKRTKCSCYRISFLNGTEIAYQIALDGKLQIEGVSQVYICKY